MKKSIQHTEHVLIPLALAIGNIALVHLIYLLAHQGLALNGPTLPVALSLALLTGGLLTKHKWLLLGTSVFYLAVLGMGLMG